MKTSLHICGLWFHISWVNDNEGYDQHGIKWINKSKPECTSKELIDTCLDLHNEITDILNQKKVKNENKI